MLSFLILSPKMESFTGMVWCWSGAGVKPNVLCKHFTSELHLQPNRSLKISEPAMLEWRSVFRSPTFMGKSRHNAWKEKQAGLRSLLTWKLRQTSGLNVQWESLPQRIRWRTIEEDSWYWFLTSRHTFTHGHMHIYTYEHIHILLKN